MLIIDFQPYLTEYKQSPNILIQKAKAIPAKVGLEMEMICPVPIVAVTTEDDMNYDEPTESIDQILTFFGHGGANLLSNMRKLSDNLNWDFDSYTERMADDAWDDVEYQKAQEYVANDYDGDEEDFDEDAEISRILNTRAFRNVEDDWKEEWINDNRETLEKDWLSRENLDYLSDVKNKFDIEWPYKKTENELNKEYYDLAYSFARSIGVNPSNIDVFTEYHANPKSPIRYTIEPDTSIIFPEGYSGIEIVSPPQSFEKSITDLSKTITWAKMVECYTSSSTGLHINLSLENVDMSRMDYMKLVLLSGDQHILGIFDRLFNTYASDATKKISNLAISEQSRQKLLSAFKSQLTAFSLKLVAQEYFRVNKNNLSISVRENRIEVRTLGGDWFDFDIQSLIGVIARYIVALDAACDENKFKEEYFKKLYLLIHRAMDTQTPQLETFATLYAKFLTGKISKQSVVDSFYNLHKK